VIWILKHSLNLWLFCSTYSVVVPDTIRSNLNYNVVVTLHRADGPSLIRVTLSGPFYTKVKEVQLQPMSTQIVTFPVPKLTGGNYQLKAEGTRGIVFKKTTQLKYVEDDTSIYIQTDKATYKPADLVQFRVLFLDRNTQPARIYKPIQVEIHDGAQNRITQIVDVRPTKGVYSGELRLSDQPVLGNWTIAVSIQDEGSESKVFVVDKYVVPKFEVTVHTANDVLASSGSLRAAIRAMYTFGKPVKGKVTVSIEGKAQERTIDIDGQVNVELPFAATDPSPLKIVATVTEDLTDLRHSGSNYVTLHEHRYRLESAFWPKRFRADRLSRFPIIVRNVDGSPISSSSEHVRFTFACCGISRTVSVGVNAGGIATAKIMLPDILCGSYHVTVTFKDAKPLIETISRLDKSLKIELNTVSPRLKQLVSFDVVSTGDLPYFMFTIVARGNILFNQYVAVQPGQFSRNIKFMPTFDMVPQATIYVHYVEDGVMRSDEKKIDFEKDFGNSIEIIAQESAEPSETVSLRVKTDPHSFVGLLGVDQSVLLLRSGNDLSRDQIFSDLGKFATPGLVILTNAQINNDEHWGKTNTENLFGLTPEPATTVQTTEPQKPPPIRKEFPETWLFSNIADFNDNNGNLTAKIPDTITSWVITGFSLNPTSGIALTKNPTRVRVFKPFFVSTNLPYSVKRGEIIAIPVVVFNYMDKPAQTSVSIDNSEQKYEFTEAVNANSVKAVHLNKMVKRVSIPANSGRSLSFMIRPKKVGLISLKITAISPLAMDSIEQMLKVEPDGVTKYVNRPILVNLNRNSRLNRRSLDAPEKSLEVEIPPEAVEDSETVFLNVGGDIQAPVLGNLDGLVRLPTGCGEQNMINFVPNILVLRFLDATNRSEPETAAKAKNFLNIGYQRELTYKNNDGSFKTFTQLENGSTWLTAFVVRSFHQANKYTYVDPRILIAGLDFLAARQLSSGEFQEQANLYDNTYGSRWALTSFVLLAFFENQERVPAYRDVIDRAVQFVAAEVDRSADLYSLAITALALQQADHNKGNALLTRLNGMARKENGLQWWEQSPNSTSRNVEITSYILLAMLENGMAVNPMPIVQWLIAQRNSNGGFKSSQDTIMGLQALTKFSLQARSPVGEIDIFLRPEYAARSVVQVRPENALKLQTRELPKATRKVLVSARGTGAALVQLAYQYNVATNDPEPSFRIRPTVMDSPRDRLVLNICAEYTPREVSERSKQSNMALMEVQLPSGYVADTNALTKIQSVPRVKRVETKNTDSHVVIYFESLTPGDPKCLTVEAARTHDVARQRPAYVVLYDYYAPERKCTEYYQVGSSLCDICQGNQCGPVC
ncbi:hypothetical protein KR038_011562, partial [Drosophila bunnanda]